MGQFFVKTSFGQKLRMISEKTNKVENREKVFKVISKNNLGLQKGDYYYLDRSHKDYFHLEVFDSTGNFKYACNLDGVVDQSKTLAAKGRKLYLK